MRRCPFCSNPVFTGLSGITRCVTGHILSIPQDLNVAMGFINWSFGPIEYITLPERTPVPTIFQEAFGEGELDA
jgi:hypothetical protein